MDARLGTAGVDECDARNDKIRPDIRRHQRPGSASIKALGARRLTMANFPVPADKTAIAIEAAKMLLEIKAVHFYAEKPFVFTSGAQIERPFSAANPCRGRKLLKRSGQMVGGARRNI